MHHLGWYTRLIKIFLECLMADILCREHVYLTMPIIKNKHYWFCISFSFLFFFFNRQIKLMCCYHQAQKSLIWGLIEIAFGLRNIYFQQQITVKKRSNEKSNKKNTKRRFIMSGNSIKVVNWFPFLSDCHMGTNEQAANLLNWFRGASGCWLMKCGRTKRRLWAVAQPTHNPSLLFLIELITPLSLSTLSLGF